MLPPFATLCAAAFLLLLVSSLPAARKPGVTVGVLVLLAGFAVTALGIRQWVAWRGYSSDEAPSERARHVLSDLKKAKERNVLLLDGGSYALCGIDGGLLEKELAKLGYSARVVHMGVGGANHFERQAMYERITRELKNRRKSKRGRWLYLAEVQDMYDDRPFAVFESNAESDRAYEYVTPTTFALGMQALASPGIDAPDRPWHLRYELLGHAMVNAFNVGIGTRLVSQSNIEPISAEAGRPRRLKRDRFRGLRPVLAQAKRKSVKGKAPSWLFDVREPREKSVWHGFWDDWVYYGIPSTKPGQLAHVMSFCNRTKTPCIAPDDVELLKSLNKSGYWQNSTHLSKKGARIYTRWLARRLRASGRLAK